MPDPGDVFRVAQNIDLPGDIETFNIFDFMVEGGSMTDAELLVALATIMTDAYDNLLADYVSAANMQDGAVNEMVWSVDQWIVERIVGTILPTFTSTNGSEMLPHASAAVVTFPSTVPKVRGRKFLSGFGEDRQAASIIIGTTLGGMALFGNEIRQPVAAGGGTVRYHILSKLGIPVLSNAARADATIGSQRRRKPGVGI